MPSTPNCKNQCFLCLKQRVSTTCDDSHIETHIVIIIVMIRTNTTVTRTDVAADSWPTVLLLLFPSAPNRVATCNISLTGCLARIRPPLCMVQQNIVWPLRPTLPVFALDSTSTGTKAFMIEIIQIRVKQNSNRTNNLTSKVHGFDLRSVASYA